MAFRTDRVGELLDGTARPVRTITSPEGVVLKVSLATRGERMVAFALDALFMNLVIVAFYSVVVLLFLSDSYRNVSLGMTLFLFLSFVVRVMYFMHFELAWQGRTPGKKICGLRVVRRGGGMLTPAAVIARNLTREVEFFLPMSLLLNFGVAGRWSALLHFGWAMALTSLPLFNRDRLRAGDMIAGTMVIMMPRRRLLDDLSASSTAGYSFTPEQLAVYGAFELQVLEELLRRPQTEESDRLLFNVYSKICRKIGVEGNREENRGENVAEPKGMGAKIPPRNVRRFLNDFYSAERAFLERGQLFGHFKDDKHSPGP
ncbi:MAG: RDD family protein [Synergistaceae bacterium]|jgi:uncharacterized RDD family membrane protein YckC|nr:RDD family protein [Synergistaceae bacterium]